MILLTVGTQLPFDRFVRMVDEIAPTLAMRVVAQIGTGRYHPVNMEYRATISPIEFETMFVAASLIVSHAGIGTVVMAQKHRKPLILFPRLAMLDEHRNDHQLATVKALQGRQGVYVAECREDLVNLLAQPLEPPLSESENPNRHRLREAIGSFIDQERRRWEDRTQGKA